MFDDLQLDAMLGRRIGCGLTGVALIDTGQLNAAAGDLLDLLRPVGRDRRMHL